MLTGHSPNVSRVYTMMYYVNAMHKREFKKKTH